MSKMEEKREAMRLENERVKRETEQRIVRKRQVCKMWRAFGPACSVTQPALPVLHLHRQPCAL